ncbi:MAG: nucleotidyltransferase family protein [Chloroflexi bacterium]|nr:nucleotidyltransferase family protein [Chloroflexota bacterium]
MATQIDICRILHPHLPELTRRYHIKSLRLFGSYVRGEQQSESDVDLLIDFDQTPTLFELMDLEEELGQILATEVDLITQRSLRGKIGHRILSEAVPV